MKTTVRKYLLVDDNVAFAENLAEIIADAGGEAALISDMRMPTMAGAELIQRIRKIDPGLPALVVTAYTADNELAAARKEGLLAVLSKPVGVPHLLELLARARRDAIVALVEDDAALADNLTDALSDCGFATVTARNLLETEHLGIRPFAALVDLRLPGGPDGEALRRLAARFPELPIIVMTAHADALPRLTDARVFYKPFDTGELLAFVEQLHGESCAQR